MNLVAITGRLTRDPKVSYTPSQLCVAKFTVAVNRPFKPDEADFISCIAFGKTGEFVEKHFKQGDGIGIGGHIQTGSYENKDGQRVYTTDVICDNVEFSLSNKGKAEPKEEPKADTLPDGFKSLDTDDMPF